MPALAVHCSTWATHRRGWSDDGRTLPAPSVSPRRRRGGRFTPSKTGTRPGNPASCALVRGLVEGWGRPDTRRLSAGGLDQVFRLGEGQSGSGSAVSPRSSLCENAVASSLAGPPTELVDQTTAADFECLGLSRNGSAGNHMAARNQIAQQVCPVLVAGWAIVHAKDHIVRAFAGSQLLLRLLHLGPFGDQLNAVDVDHAR